MFYLLRALFLAIPESSVVTEWSNDHCYTILSHTLPAT